MKLKEKANDRDVDWEPSGDIKIRGLNYTKWVFSESVILSIRPIVVVPIPVILFYYSIDSTPQERTAKLQAKAPSVLQ